MLQQIMDGAWTLLTYFGPFIVVVSIVVFVHEYGHFWVARRCGVKVESFSIGMGKEIFGYTDKHGTRWRYSWLPIGGYVQMYGDADPASFTQDPNAAVMTADERSVAFFAQNVWKRIAIIAAGPGANYLFALLLWFAFVLYMGKPSEPPVIKSFAEVSAAREAGMQAGDRILKIDGNLVASFLEVRKYISTVARGVPLQVEFMRGTETMQLQVKPIVDDKNTVTRLGITGEKHYTPTGVGGAIVEATDKVYFITTETLNVVGQMIAGTRSAQELGGPLMIAKLSGDVFKEQDAHSIIYFFVLISVSLGLVNLFPIPLLDGGHIFFYLIEAVRRRPLPTRVQEYAARIGFGTVLFIIGFTLWNDLVSLKILPYLKTLFS